MAYSFNGSSQYLSFNSCPVAAYPCTLACWFRTTSVTANQALVSLCVASSGGVLLLNAAGAVAGDPIRAAATNTSGATIVSADTTTPYVANRWTHAAATFETGTIAAWVDGAGATTNSTLPTPAVTATAIGARLANNAVQGYTAGQIAEVGMWSAALTAAEIASLSLGISCSLVRPQSLVFFAPLIRNLTDESRGLTITNNGGSTVSVHPRIYL